MVNMVELTGFTKNHLVDLLQTKEQDPTLTRWILFIKRGPVAISSKKFRTVGPTSPYEGLLLLYRDGEQPCVKEKQMQYRVAMGEFNMVVRLARSGPVGRAIYFATMT